LQIQLIDVQIQEIEAKNNKNIEKQSTSVTASAKGSSINTLV